MIPSIIKSSLLTKKPSIRNISVLKNLQIDSSKIPSKEKILLLDKLNYQKELDIHYKNTYILPTIISLEKKNNKSKKDKLMLEMYHEMLADTNDVINEINDDINELNDSVNEDYKILEEDDNNIGGNIKKNKKKTKRKYKSKINKRIRKKKNKTNKKSRK